MLTRKERLMRTIAGLSVDRPAVSFYEINGLTQRCDDSDRFNIFHDPSWKPLIQLAQEKTDRLVMTAALASRDGRLLDLLPPAIVEQRCEEKDDRRYYHTRVQAAGQELRSTYMVEADVNTSWCLDHLIKDVDDLRAWIDLPEEELRGEAYTADILRQEAELGDSGVVMIDSGDPLCTVAGLMAMDEFTVIALTEPELFREALEKALRFQLWVTEQVAAALPGRIWRICGPEYACPPYLPPELFHEYVTCFDRQLVEVIRRHGGYPRIHCHGRIREVLDEIVATGVVALDPIELPPQGDVSLAYVREKYGRELTLFGNLEASDIENLESEAFRGKVRQALEEGTGGEGRGFVLMPSACPYGRKLSARAMRNYEVMIEEVEALS